jgi:hypothetical protein
MGLNELVWLQEAEETRDGILFHRVGEVSHAIPHSPSFIFGEYPAKVARSYYAFSGLGERGLWSITDAEVHGPHHIVRDGALFWCPLLNIHQGHVEKYLTEQVDRPVRHLAGSYAMITGPGHWIYGHWLIDHMPKLFMLSECGFALAEQRFLMPVKTPKFVLAILDILGINETQIEYYDPEREIIRVDLLLVPGIFHNGVRMAPEFEQAYGLLNRMIDAGGEIDPSPEAGERIFLSRRHASQSRRCLNRADIEAVATECGLAIVYPEQMPFRRQVPLFRQARLIVGEYGSALHGSIFAPPGTVICGLRGSGFHPGFIQSGIGHVLGQPTGYVFGQTTPDDPHMSFTVPPEEFRACLEVIGSGTGFE